ncbi:Endocytosis and vacuole integrity protein [Ophidiomyces ophidiicola]|nr:Endocytosis and vacuole integrity protein [Ophidiomyces ophidiicola]
MTSQFLQGELTSLINESKRKNSDLRNAAESSLHDLKAIPSTSEVQLAADLLRKPHFVRPFVLACHTRHAKLAVLGVGSIQRLVASGALPPEQLESVVDGLHQTTNISLDVQLKVLQTLPTLFQRYSDNLKDRLLANVLELCATLQTVRATAVSNTAAATLQQLAVSVFEKVSREDENLDDSVTLVSISLGNESINISGASYDAFRVLDDLCRLVEGETLEFLRIKSLSKIFVLELIESILVSNNNVFTRHPEHAHILRYRLLPLIVRFLSERHGFPITVRLARILLLLLKSHIQLLVSESEVALSLLVHLLEIDVSPPWKRAICMELCRGIFSEPGLIMIIFRLFDQQEKRKDIVRAFVACFVRLAAENPSLIGVGHQSTVPVEPALSADTIEDQVALEAVGVAGVFGGPSKNTDAYGISSQWSLLRVPYIETLDKLEAPVPPETYIYTLVLNCISSFSENIARFILPLTVAETKSRRKYGHFALTKTGTANSDDAKAVNELKNSKDVFIPVNPLELKSHPQIEDIEIIAAIIDSCWPAILATSSTFLYAALESDYYHNLVRAFQKLAHVAGLLRLTTPRDAFLTTLGKAAVPADTLNTSSLASLPQKLEDHVSFTESPLPSSPSNAEHPRLPNENKGIFLDTRNLLCLRALLNLGIALGPSLDQCSWSIILETLQHADLILDVSTSSITKPAATDQSPEKGFTVGADLSKGNVGTEILAVRTAAMKLFESTQNYPDTALGLLMRALLSLSELTKEYDDPSSPVFETIPQSGRVRQNRRNLSIALGRPKVQEDELRFILAKMGDLTKASIERLTINREESIWQVIVNFLVAITKNEQVSSQLRSRASVVLNELAFDMIKLGNSFEPSCRNEVQLRGLHALKAQISGLYKSERRPSSAVRSSDFHVHELALGTLKSVLEECGDSITAGWDLVFSLISSVFDKQDTGPQKHSQGPSVIPRISSPEAVSVKSPKLLRTAYDSLQLIVSDFIALLPVSCLLQLVETFSYFASQKEDFNISLTTTTFFWNTSDFLCGRFGNFVITEKFNVGSTEEELIVLATTTDSTIANNALWLLLLLKIVHVSVDNRTEIRNNAIQTIFRILDNQGQQLPPDAWHICLNHVLLVMAESVQKKLFEALHSTETGNTNIQKAWVETVVLLTKGLSDLITNFFDTVIHDSEFNQSWHRLLEYFDSILNSRLLELTSSIFTSFAKILRRIKNRQDVSLEALEEAWAIWTSNHPAKEGQRSNTSNQDAFLAYLNTYEQLYRLLGSSLGEEQVAQVLANLKLCVWESIMPQYSSDLERQSEPQKSVVGCLRALCLDKPSSQREIIDCLAKLSDSALTRWSPEHGKEKPTFVAFSKACLQLFSWYMMERGVRVDFFSGNTIPEAIGHLVNPVLNKYLWLGKDCNPPIWQVAATSSLDILQVLIPSVEKAYEHVEKKTAASFWARVADLTRGIAAAEGYEEDNRGTAILAEDERFDMEAFTRLRVLIIPSLGSPFIPDTIRQEFAFILFRFSLIYPPNYNDVSFEDLKTQPLENLYQVRRGRTVSSRPTLRSNLSYFLIDTLFELASTHEFALETGPNSLESYKTLAKSVSPYLILRCAIALKSYIADQPLRGLMPQPIIARKELLYLLQKLTALRSTPTAIPPAGPTVPVRTTTDQTEAMDKDVRYKKHLGWVYPLAVKSIQVAARAPDDQEIMRMLTELLESIAGDCASNA